MTGGEARDENGIHKNRMSSHRANLCPVRIANAGRSLSKNNFDAKFRYYKKNPSYFLSQVKSLLLLIVFLPRRIKKQHLLALLKMINLTLMWLKYQLIRIYRDLQLAILYIMQRLLFVSGLPLLLFGFENTIVHNIRARFVSKIRSQFQDINDYIAYVFDIARDNKCPLGARIRSILSLIKAPLADQLLVNELLKFAEEVKQPQFRDAIFQAIDSIENRLRRGQSSTIDFDINFFSREMNFKLSHGIFLRRYVFGAIIALTIGFLTFWFAWYSATVPNLTKDLLIIELLLALSLLGYFLVTRGKASSIRLWALTAGMGLLFSLFWPPDQMKSEPLLWSDFIYSCIPRLWVFLVGALTGRIIYYIDSDERPETFDKAEFGDSCSAPHFLDTKTAFVKEL